MTIKELDELTDALTDFKLAYKRLLNKWQGEATALGSINYPFQESFDELAVFPWIESFQKEIIAETTKKFKELG